MGCAIRIAFVRMDLVVAMKMQARIAGSSLRNSFQAYFESRLILEPDVDLIP